MLDQNFLDESFIFMAKVFSYEIKQERQFVTTSLFKKI